MASLASSARRSSRRSSSSVDVLDELRNLSAHVTRTHERVARQVTNERTTHGRQITALEVRVNDLEEHVRHLDLDAESGQAQRRKLRNARRVIRDLIDDRRGQEAQHSPDAGTLVLRDERPLHERALDALDSPSVRSNRSATNSILNGRDSANRTPRPRPHPSGTPTAVPSSPGRTSNTRHSSNSVRTPAPQPHVRAAAQRSPQVGGVPSPRTTGSRTSSRAAPIPTPASSLVSASAPPSLDVSVHGGRDDQGEESDWRVLVHAPRSSEVQARALTCDQLRSRLRLSQDVMDQLETLKYGQGNSGLNVYIEGEVAFVGNPFTLEGPDGSHLIDWGTSDLNARMEQYIQDRPGGTALHTFFWHSRTGKWFYIGAHIWTPVGLTWEVWRTLSERVRVLFYGLFGFRGLKLKGRFAALMACLALSCRSVRMSQSQEFVANRLRMRGGEVETEAQIIAQLDSNRLEQIVIELSSVGQRETSEAFLREYGLSPRRRHPRLS